MRILGWASVFTFLLLGLWDGELLHSRLEAESRAAAVSSRIEVLRAALNRDRAALAAKGPAESTESFATIADPIAAGWAREALARAEVLQQRMRTEPGRRIPEMQFLAPADWARVAALAGVLASEGDFRRAFAAVRLAAIRDFGQRLQPALRAYLAMSHEQLPTDLSELVPYIDPPIDPSILARYRMAEAGPAYGGHPLQEGRPHPAPIEEIPEALPDPVYDRIATISSGGIVGSYANYDYPARRQADDAFQAAHPGQRISAPEDVVPYFKDPAVAARYVEVAKAQRDFGGN